MLYLFRPQIEISNFDMISPDYAVRWILGSLWSPLSIEHLWDVARCMLNRNISNHLWKNIKCFLTLICAASRGLTKLFVTIRISHVETPKNQKNMRKIIFSLYAKNRIQWVKNNSSRRSLTWFLRYHFALSSDVTKVSHVSKEPKNPS